VKVARQKQGLAGKNKSSTVPPVCITFQKTNSCAFGDKCRYRHLSADEIASLGEDDVGQTQVQLPGWLSTEKVIPPPYVSGMGFQYYELQASPQVDGYRNKCEYTVGLNEKGEITVGFRVGSYLGGSVSVDSPTECPNVAEVSSGICFFFLSCCVLM
jgi:hypothetical protein